MSTSRHKGLKSGHLLLILILLLVVIGGAAVCWTFSFSFTDGDKKAELFHGPNSGDPLPGELVKQIVYEDSVRTLRRGQLKEAMTNVIKDYRKKFRQEHFTGYFLTDLDKDGLPELWVKVGNYRDNSKLELYYPMADGTLLKSETFAEPGQYYIGEDYIIQMVGSGPGYIDVNKISLNNGVMSIENVNGIDLYSDPTASLPTFAEREIRDSSFNNLSTLDRALL